MIGYMVVVLKKQEDGKAKEVPKPTPQDRRISFGSQFLLDAIKEKEQVCMVVNFMF